MMSPEGTEIEVDYQYIPLQTDSNEGNFGPHMERSEY